MTTDEDKIFSIYQQGKKQNPPAHLDNAILKAAHDAVDKTQHEDISSVVRGTFSGSWRATASIAAVLIITVILLPLIEQEVSAPAVSGAPVDTLINEMSLQKQSYRQEKTMPENKKFRKEKPKKRKVDAVTKVIPDKNVELSPHLSFSEISSPVSSASPKPNVITSISNKSQQVGLTSVIVRKKAMMNDLDYSEVESEFKYIAPQQWLDKIRQLINDGKLKAAKKELNAFQLLYPDKAIDETITHQLTQQP